MVNNLCNTSFTISLTGGTQINFFFTLQQINWKWFFKLLGLLLLLRLSSILLSYMIDIICPMICLFKCKAILGLGRSILILQNRHFDYRVDYTRLHRAEKKVLRLNNFSGQIGDRSSIVVLFILYYLPFCLWAKDCSCSGDWQIPVDSIG